MLNNSKLIKVKTKLKVDYKLFFYLFMKKETIFKLY